VKKRTSEAANTAASEVLESISNGSKRSENETSVEDGSQAGGNNEFGEEKAESGSRIPCSGVREIWKVSPAGAGKDGAG
jgi:hypothetical protein